MKTIEEIIDKIHLGKWEDVMPSIPACSVDLIVTSPPYNVSLGVGNKHKVDSYDSYDDNMPYEDYLNWMKKLFYQCNRVLKVGGRLCINIGDGANGSVPSHADFTHMLTREICRGCFVVDSGNDWQDAPEIYKPFQMMTTIVWDKNQIGASTAWGSWQSPSCPSFPTQFEFIIVVSKGTLKHEGDKSKITVSKENFIRNSRALWSFPCEGQMMKKYDHPACFPEELPCRLIDQLTYEDDIVLDPFSGSGTSCAVAKKMKRHYIGIEMSPKYHSKSEDRLSSIAEVVRTKSGLPIPKWLE